MPRGGIHISQCNHDFAGQRSDSDSYSETAGWMAALPLAERSFTRKGKKILQHPNQKMLWFIKQNLKKEKALHELKVIKSEKRLNSL